MVKHRQSTPVPRNLFGVLAPVPRIGEGKSQANCPGTPDRAGYWRKYHGTNAPSAALGRGHPGSGPVVRGVAVLLLEVALLKKHGPAALPGGGDLERADAGDVGDRSASAEVHVVGLDEQISLAQLGHALSESLDASFKELPLELEVGCLAARPG